MPTRLWIWLQNSLSVLVIGVAPLSSSVSIIPEWLHWPPRLLGGVGIIVGAYFGIAGVRDLGANRTPHPVPKGPSKLVTHGIYARVRHPLYSSLILVSFGWALVWLSGAALVPAVALTSLLIGKARVEESFLRRRYPEYVAYESRVGRFF
ncbi:MAG: isoprenylcysteine carboxylmethyltransferase family protein [Verrucomicrobium sp.]